MTRKIKGIRERADGRIEWRFTYNGQTYSGYASSIREAKEHLENMKHDVKNGLYSKETNLTLDAWFTKWLDTYKTADCKASTINLYTLTYNRYISPVFGKKKIKTLTADQIQRFTNQKAKEFSKSIASTINFLLFDCLRQAARLKLINQNPMDNTTPPKFKKAEHKKALTSEITNAFFEYCKESSYYSIFRTAALSGMRIGEILGLPWENVDFDNEKLWVRQILCYTTEKGQYIDKPKSENSIRWIPMEQGDELFELMKKRRTEQNRQRLHMGEHWKTKQGMENLVFTTKTGSPHSDMNVRTVMRTIVNKMREDGYKVESLTPHTLRHCFATRCIENGMDYSTLQKILGHSTLQITMDLYVDTMEEMKVREMRKVKAAL